MADTRIFHNAQPLTLPGWGWDFRALDLDRFPLVNDFQVVLHDTGSSLGLHLWFWSDRLGQLAGFPWLDNPELPLQRCALADIPLGTPDQPYHDLEQGWQVFVFQIDDCVYVLEAGEPGDEPIIAHSWFRVPRQRYVDAWRASLAGLGNYLADGVPPQGIHGWQGHACLDCRMKTHRYTLKEET